MNSLSLCLIHGTLKQPLNLKGAENTWEADLCSAQEDRDMHLFPQSYHSTECSGKGIKREYACQELFKSQQTASMTIFISFVENYPDAHHKDKIK